MAQDELLLLGGYVAQFGDPFRGHDLTDDKGKPEPPDLSHVDRELMLKLVTTGLKDIAKVTLSNNQKLRDIDKRLKALEGEGK